MITRAALWNFLKSFVQPDSQRNEWGDRRSFGAVSTVDFSLIAPIVALLVIGLVMVYSASIALGDSAKYNTSETHFIVRQIVFLFVGLIAGGITFLIPIKNWERLSYPLGVIGIVLLIIIFVPGVGKTVNGATRWINLGVVNLQVSEIVKFVSILVVSRFALERQNFMHSYTHGFIPIMVYVCMVAGLLAFQPDLGATVVILGIIIGLVFMAGLSMKIVAFLASVMVGVAVTSIAMAPWRTARLLAYLSPWAPDYQFGAGYQLTHSLMAIGRGEVFGVGLGASVEKLHYLPEAHTDFILAVIGEEFGLLGMVVVIGLFYWLTRRAFEVGRQAVRLDSAFAGLVAQGIGLWIGVQAIFNIGVVTGLYPTKGLTLPLVSYGGSSLVITLCALAVLIRVDYENRLLMRGKRKV